MAQTPGISNNGNDSTTRLALEESLDILGNQSKNLVLYVLAEKVKTDLSSVEAIEQSMNYLLGPHAKIIMDSVKQRLQT
jgi:hypothetical protein